MHNLLSLEIKRIPIRSYHITALFCGTSLLFFHYFMAAIPFIDPADPDTVLFSSYEFLFHLNHLFSMAVFGIIGAVMGTRLVIEEYHSARAILVFSYPIKRKKVMEVKLFWVFCYPAASMLLCGMVTCIIFLITEILFPLCTTPFTSKTLLWIFCSLFCHALLTGAVSLFSLWIGFLKKSIPAAIITGVITVTVLCQVLTTAFVFRSILYLLLCFSAIVSQLIVRHLLSQVENMEV